MVAQSHVTQEQRPQGFGHVDSAGHMNQAQQPQGIGHVDCAGHMTQGQQPQGFGHVDSAGHVTQEPLPSGGRGLWPGYPGSEAPPAFYFKSQATSPPIYTAYRQRTSTVLGALQVTAALICTILNFAGMIFVPVQADSFYAGIVFSLLYIIAGSLAITAGWQARRGVVIGSTVMSAISVGVALAYCVTITILTSYSFHDKVISGLWSLLAIFSFIESIVAVWTAVLGIVVSRCGSQATQIVTQTKTVYVQDPQQHSGQDGNLQSLVPGNPSSYPTYSTPSPEEVYDTIPDDIPEVSTTDVYFTIDHSSPAETNPYIQVIDQPDVGGVPSSSDGVYLQPETDTIPDVIPAVRDQSMYHNTTDVYLTIDHSSPAETNPYLQAID